MSEPLEYDLHDVEAQFISFVPRGANKKEYLAVVKELNEDIVKTILETPDEDLQKALHEAGLEGEGAGALVGASKLLKAYKDVLPENAIALLAKCTGLALPESLKLVKDVPDKAGAGAGAGAEEETKGELSKETLEKLDPGIRSLLEKTLAERDQAKATADQALSLAKELKDEKILKEYVEKAANLPHLAIEPLKFGPVLKALGEGHPAEFSEIFRVLMAADAAIEKSMLFKEIGKASSGESDAEAVVYARARAMVAKDGNLTLEGAISKVLEKDPQLYEKYEDERQAAARKRGGK